MNKKTLFRSAGGYTLLEALLAMAMSAILLMAISGLVGSLFHAYQISRQSQIDLEEARTALGVVTKTVRPATLTNSSGQVLSSSPHDSSILYAYSNDSKQCISFRFVSNSLEYATFVSTISDPKKSVKERAGGCNFSIHTGDYKKVVMNKITGGLFHQVPSKPLDMTVGSETDGAAGRVTVQFTVQTDATHKSDLQTTVSLRDYEYVGFKK
ncbi:MAG: hypothetical protein WCG84_01460 [Candidatus Moraniibacteriota bacterium]